jgi:hypothetical protein
MKRVVGVACLALAASPAYGSYIKITVEAAAPGDVKEFRYARASDFDGLGRTPAERVAALQNSKFDSNITVGYPIRVEAGEAYRFLPFCAGRLRAFGAPVTIDPRRPRVPIQCRP